MNPETFMHDINAVCSLLKQFFRELPDPLFTQQQYPNFIAAASTYRLNSLPYSYIIN